WPLDSAAGLAGRASDGLPLPSLARPANPQFHITKETASNLAFDIEEAFMKGDPQVIDALNRALTIELTAINQYFCQAKMCMNWGYKLLGKKHYEESMGEMKHAEKLIDRILFLDGTPEIARYDVIRVGTNVKEQF